MAAFCRPSLLSTALPLAEGRARATQRLVSEAEQTAAVSWALRACCTNFGKEIEILFFQKVFFQFLILVLKVTTEFPGDKDIHRAMNSTLVLVFIL